MSNLFFNLIEEAFYRNGISIKPFQNSEWDEFLNNQEYVPVLYSTSFIEYQFAYFKPLNYENASVQLYSLGDKKLIGVWPLFFKSSENKKIILETYGGPIIAPFISDQFDHNTRKKYFKNCYLSIDDLNKHGDVEIQEFANYNYLNHEIDPWQSLLEFSENTNLKSMQFESVLNLKLPLEELKMRIRKSYKSLINKGFKLWTIVEITDNIDYQFNEFRKLHFEVAGRKTRSDESWEIQMSNLKRGCAKLICAYNNEKKLVGGAFFDLTKHEANYSIGVYDRKLFDLPIAHAIQWKAIEIFKELGLKKYKIGLILRNNLLNQVSEKELAISTFKSGFGGDLFSITFLERNFQ